MDGLDDDVREIRELQLERAKYEGKLVNFGGEISYDREILGAVDKDQYETSIAVNDDDEADDRDSFRGEQDSKRRFLNSFTAPKAFLEDTRDKDFDPFKDMTKKTIKDKEDEYHARWRKRKLAPPRADAFSKDAKNNSEDYSYKDHMLETILENERQEVLKKIEEKQKEEQKQREEQKKKAKKELKKAKKSKREDSRHNNNNDDTPPGRRDSDFAEWKLEVSKRGAQLPSITLDADMTLAFGRGDAADVKLEHESCSKNHAKITFMSNTPHIMDLNSTNGTFVNGTEITAGEWRKLAENDIIKFGCSTREYKVKCL